jgi:hypothetical protein
VRRNEHRRAKREKEAHAMNVLLGSTVDHADWERLRAVLDASMHELKARDRAAVLLRFSRTAPLLTWGSTSASGKTRRA